jgi:hypothetical protein
MVIAMGGKCSVCGYANCDDALGFHHLDPSKKLFTLGGTRANPKNWNDVVNELRKCILVCHNCHSEIHAGMVDIPSNAPKFNEEYADYIKRDRELKMIKCPICSTLMSASNTTCSYKCAGTIRYKIDWDSIDLKTELENKSYLQISKELGVSDVAVHKRAKKLGLK